MKRIWMMALLIGCLLPRGRIAAGEDAHARAAQRFLQAMEIETVFDRVARSATDQIVRQRFELAPHEVAIREIFREQLDRDDLKASLARLMISTFSEQELNEIAAFYNTPAGKKSLRTLPGVNRSILQIITQHLQQNNPQVSAGIRELLRRDAEAREAAGADAE